MSGKREGQKNKQLDIDKRHGVDRNKKECETGQWGEKAQGKDFRQTRLDGNGSAKGAIPGVRKCK